MQRLCSGWARARLGDEEAGLTELRQALAALTEQGAKFAVPYFQASLAEIEAKMGSAEGALIQIDAALALANETGEHQNEGFLHRVRGEMLLKRDPANTAPAEEAFLAAVAVARQQKARSLELRAALSLAKLYQSAGRAADAHAVLAPALEGFSPTPEFPEIEEAQTLLAALAETDEVRQAAASRHRRLKLQTSLRSGDDVVQRLRLGRNESRLQPAPKNSPRGAIMQLRDLQPTTGCGSAPSRAASLGWHRTLPRLSGAKQRMAHS